MDAPRIVIGLAGDIAAELARDDRYDRQSLKEIVDHFFRAQGRLGRLRTLLNEPQYARLVTTRLIEDGQRRQSDPANSHLRRQARLEADIRSQSDQSVPTMLGFFVLDQPGLDEPGADTLVERLRTLIQ